MTTIELLKEVSANSAKASLYRNIIKIFHTEHPKELSIDFTKVYDKKIAKDADLANLIRGIIRIKYIETDRFILFESNDHELREISADIGKYVFTEMPLQPNGFFMNYGDWDTHDEMIILTGRRKGVTCYRKDTLEEFTETNLFNFLKQIPSATEKEKMGVRSYFDNFAKGKIGKNKDIVHHFSPILINEDCVGTVYLVLSNEGENFLSEFSGKLEFKDSFFALYSLIHFVAELVVSVVTQHALKNASLKSAIAAIMSRNMSHNLGSHVVTNAKHQIEELERKQVDDSVREQLKGLSGLLQYLQEQQDFIAVIANDEHYPKGPLNFKSSVFDILAMDGPPRRHGSPKVNNYILDNIVRSEGIARAGSVSGDTGTLGIEIQLVKLDGLGYAKTFKSLEQQEIGNEFSNFTLSVNNGLNGRQALLTIIENFIRNSAKHNHEAFANLENNDLLFSVIFKENRENGFFEITICDNKRNFADLKRKFINSGLIQNGRLAPLHILREDGNGIDRDNKGIKEILISLAWLKYGENIKSSTAEVNYDTLQNAPWELLDVVGVDNANYVSYEFDAPAQPQNLSLGYRFRLAKYKDVHLLSPAEFSNGERDISECLSALPGASIYVVRQSDYGAGNKVLNAIPRLEVVSDAETEETLKAHLDDLLERNVKRRFGVDILPRLRISESSSNRKPRNDWDGQRTIVREYAEQFDDTWARDYPGEFIHYRNHYETVLQGSEDLDLRDGAGFTEGISGGNYTNTLLRTDITRFSYLSIVEAALVQIAIVDERIFAKYAGRTPEEASAAAKPDDLRWEYLRQKGIHIVNSDGKRIYDLRGTIIPTASTGAFDFLSIHLGLMDKTSGTGEREKLDNALRLFGPCYDARRTKIVVHSGRGGLTQIEDIAFVPLSGIEWALENCKYSLSDFFHGLKCPPAGDVAGRGAAPQPLPYRPAQPAALSVSPGNAAVRNTGAPVGVSSPSPTGNLPPIPARAATGSVKRVFLFTTYEFGETALYGSASGETAVSGIERFIPWEEIQKKAGNDAGHFRKLAHIDSTFFFYPPSARPAPISPDKHSDFIHHLLEAVLSTAGRGDFGAVELHLILHASDVRRAKNANTKDSDDPLIAQIKKKFPTVVDATIWWFSHDGTGIHRNVVCKGKFFDGVNDKASHLLNTLAKCTRTQLPVATASANGFWRPAGYARAGNPVGKCIVTERSECLEVRLTESFVLTKVLLNRFAAWQLAGSADRAALEALFNKPDDSNEDIWSPVSPPSSCRLRITVPKPVLFAGPLPLKVFGEEDRRAHYLDSSIWCRYASNDGDAAAIRNQFADHAALGLYRSNAAKEHLELWARLAINSRYGEFSESGRGHSKIVPLVFHSESAMAKKTAEHLERLNRDFSSRPLKWKILLFDDHAQTSLSGETPSSKLDVIRKTLTPIFAIQTTGVGDEAGKRPVIDFHYAETKEAAVALVEAHRFDIILLDYLLDKTSSEKGFETSDEYLLKLKEGEQKKGKWASVRGPREKFWFFNASAFARAVESKLTADGLSYSETSWEIDKGADPVNTPELFKHNLLAFMLRQLEALTNLPSQKTTNNGVRIVSLLDLLRAIFMPENGTVRDAAALRTNDLQHFRADYKILLKDIQYGLPASADNATLQALRNNPGKSEIVFSLFPDIVHYTELFWSHLLHLVYITAHGTPQQWPRLYESFREIEGTLLRANKEVNKPAAKELVAKIDSYIRGLNKKY